MRKINCKCCNGKGEIAYKDANKMMSTRRFNTLARTNGDLRECPVCHGTGKVEEQKKVIGDLCQMVVDYVAHEADKADKQSIPLKGCAEIVVDLFHLTAVVCDGDYVFENISREVTNSLMPVFWQLKYARDRRIEWEERERRDRLETESWLNGVGRFV